METAIERKIVEQDWIDRVADPVQGAIRPLLDRAPAVADALHGKWLGHPLHAAMTDVPVGAWTAGLALDLIDVVGGNRKLRRAADTVHTIGLVSALGAAVAGLADWSTTTREAKRVGFVHGMTNGVIAGLYGASLVARSRKRRGLGIALSTVGYGLLLFSSWLGGELSYRHGVGVRREALPRGDALPEGARERGALGKEPLVTLAER